MASSLDPCLLSLTGYIITCFTTAQEFIIRSYTVPFILSIKYHNGFCCGFIVMLNCFDGHVFIYGLFKTL